MRTRVRSTQFNRHLRFEEPPQHCGRHSPDIISEMVRLLGYARNNRVRLYGEVFDLVSDPVRIGENLIFVNGKQVKSGHVTRVRIPESIVETARIRYYTAQRLNRKVQTLSTATICGENRLTGERSAGLLSCPVVLSPPSCHKN